MVFASSNLYVYVFSINSEGRVKCQFAYSPWSDSPRQNLHPTVKSTVKPQSLFIMSRV